MTVLAGLLAVAVPAALLAHGAAGRFGPRTAAAVGITFALWLPASFRLADGSVVLLLLLGVGIPAATLAALSWRGGR